MYVHELSIATAILESLEKEPRCKGLRTLAVGVRIGELSGVDADSLMFGWEAMTKATAWDGVLLKVEGVPWVNRCNQCEHEFRVVEYQTQCTSCGEVETTLVRGKELEIAYIEVEEQEVAAG
jgi:hydrogenase nickel incorporation protein HypA/HybF